MSTDHKDNHGLWPAHYDPFGLDRPQLPTPKPQPPLLVVIEESENPAIQEVPQASKWMVKLLWVLALLYGFVFSLSLIHQSQTDREAVIYDPLLIIQNNGRTVK